MEIEALKRNIAAVRARVSEAAAGRSVTIVAATKTVPPELISEAIDLGMTDVGENRVREYLDKRDAVKSVKWHFIGTLQSNKAKYLVGNVALIQSVNSVMLAEKIDALAEKRGVVQDVLVEVNVGGEASKSGVPIGQAEELIERAERLEHIAVRGLMAVPPIDAADGIYIALRDLFERNKRPGFDTLSVGMSGDYEKAIGFGSNMVRIGSAIFGKRSAT